jgi:putative FmdB family regulatory protein
VPTYDYECQQCNRTFEVRQRISAAPLTKCQACGGPVRRLLAAAPFILKGRGWYVTDYPSESRKKAMEAEKKAAPAETAAGATSTPAPSSSPAGSSSDVASGSTATPTATKD